MAKKKGKKRAASRRAPEVTLRFANEGTMAKKNAGKKGGHRKGGHRKGGHRKGGHGRRRRRNPGFMDRFGKLLGVAAVALGTGVVVTVAQSKIAPGNPLSLYGIPAAGFVGGVAIAGKMPTVGIGAAAGSLAGFAIPIASQALGNFSGGSTASTAAGLGRAFRNLRAVDMHRMGAVDMRGAWDARGTPHYARG